MSRDTTMARRGKAICPVDETHKHVKWSTKVPGNLFCNTCARPYNEREQFAIRELGYEPAPEDREAWSRVFAAAEAQGVSLRKSGSSAPRPGHAPPTDAERGVMVRRERVEEDAWLLDHERGEDLWRLSVSSSGSRVSATDKAYLREVHGCAGVAEVRVIPEGQAVPDWGVRSMGRWVADGYRMMTLLYDCDGVARAPRLRLAQAPRKADAAKVAHLSGAPVRGTMLLCRVAKSWMRDLAAGAEDITPPPVVVWLEGDKDWAAALGHWRDVHSAWAFVGVISGSVTHDWIERMAMAGETTRHLLLTDPDGAGDRYAAKIESLWEEVTGDAMPATRLDPAEIAASPLPPYDADKAPDIADVIKAGCAPKRLDGLLTLPERYLSEDDRTRGLILRVRDLALQQFTAFAVTPATGGLGYYARASDETQTFLASAVPVVTCRLTDERGQALYRVSWDCLLTRTVRHADIPAGAPGTQIAAALGAAGLIVTAADDRKMLGAWVSYTAVAGARVVPQRILVDVCGWYDGGFLLGEHWVSRDEEADRVELSSASLHGPHGRLMRALGPARNGDLKAWLGAMRGLRPHPVPGLAILTLLAAPLLRRLGVHEGSFLFLAADEGTAKSLCCTLALSVMGDPTNGGGVYRNWVGSAAGREQAAQALQHLGMVLDDTGTLSQGGGRADAVLARSATVAQEVYQLANGTPRDIVRSADRLSGAWLGCYLATGEQPPFDTTSMGSITHGAIKRTCVVNAFPWGKPVKDDEALLSLFRVVARAAEEHYGTLMPAFLAEIMRHPATSQTAMWQRESKHWTDVLTRGGAQYPVQRGGFLGVLSVAMHHLKQVASAHGHASPVDDRAIGWLADHLSVAGGGAATGALAQVWPSLREWALARLTEDGPFWLRDWQGRWVNEKARKEVVYGRWNMVRPNLEALADDDTGGIGDPGDLYLTQEGLKAWHLWTGGLPVSVSHAIRHLIQQEIIEPGSVGRKKQWKQRAPQGQLPPCYKIRAEAWAAEE